MSPSLNKVDLFIYLTHLQRTIYYISLHSVKTTCNRKMHLQPHRQDNHLLRRHLFFFFFFFLLDFCFLFAVAILWQGRTEAQELHAFCNQSKPNVTKSKCETIQLRSEQFQNISYLPPHVHSELVELAVDSQPPVE